MNNCNCNCHKVKLHNPSCAIIQAGSMARKKKIKCNCVPRLSNNAICTNCFENHKNHEHYKTAKSGAELAARF